MVFAGISMSFSVASGLVCPHTCTMPMLEETHNTIEIKGLTQICVHSCFSVVLFLRLSPELYSLYITPIISKRYIQNLCMGLSRQKPILWRWTPQSLKQGANARLPELCMEQGWEEVGAREASEVASSHTPASCPHSTPTWNLTWILSCLCHFPNIRGHFMCQQ